MTMPLINCRREMKRQHSLLKKVSSFMHVWRNAGLKSCMNTATKHIPEKITSKLSNCYESVSWGKKVYDIFNKKESIFSSTSGNSSSKEQGSNQPLLNIDSSNISIRVLLQHVNDWQGRPYVNSDGTPNYGIYFRDNKTGGVMYIGNHPRSCGKD